MKPITTLFRKVIVILFALLVTWFTFYNIISDPAHIVHELGGDGMKNYFSLLYHVMYGSGWWFDGMNYPYGEHIMFVDGQPILSVTLAYLRNHIDLTPEIVNVVLNLAMSFGYFLAIIFVYRILAKFGVQYFFALFFAAVIIGVSMQNFTVYGQYGLSYAFVVPMTFYWFICYRESQKYKYLIFIFSLSIICMFLHPYLLALILVWSGFYVLGYFIIERTTKKEKAKHVIPVVILMLVSVLVLKTVTGLTDPVKDRPDYPHGLLSYCTTGANLIKQPNSPFTNFLDDKGILSSVKVHTTSYAYIGLVALSIVVILIIHTLISQSRNKNNLWDNSLKIFSPVWVFIGFCALLFSMGVPFVWGLDFLHDYISALRQFRSLDFFALLFYYVAAILAVVAVYNLLVKYASTQKARSVGYATMFAVLSIWGYEAYGIIQNLNKKGDNVGHNYDFFYSQNEKSWNELLEECNYTPSDFQAILHLSYYHVGSEKIWLYKSAWGLSLAMKAAFQLHLPLVDANMSRSSWEQTFKQVKIGGGPYTNKHLLNNVDNTKPYLLLYFEYDKLNPDEQYIIDQATFLGRTSNVMAYAIYPDDWQQKESKLKTHVKSIASKMVCDDTSFNAATYYYKHYDNQPSKKILFGDGASMPVWDRDTSFEVINVTAWPKDTLYESSIWVLVNHIGYRAPNVEVSIFDLQGNRIAIHNMHCSKATDIKEMWFRASSFFKIPPTATTIVLTLRESDNTYYSLDELLIRQANDTVLSKDGQERIMANNHLLE